MSQLSIDELRVQRTLILTGAYGSGKTECAMALAGVLREKVPVTLIDLDFVNPYFRAQDHRAALEQLGVRVMGPDPSVAPIDSPSMPPGAREAMAHPSGYTVVDLGGDPAGATVIGQFATDLSAYDFWAVVNFFRPTTPNPEEAAVVLSEVADAARLRLTGLISNTHLGRETSTADVLDGLAQARGLGALLEIPVVLISVPTFVALPPLDLPLLRITPRLLRPWER